VPFWPVPVTAQAVMTSTKGHPRLIWPVAAKVNNTSGGKATNVADNQNIAGWLSSKC